jgi:hypothetical protein
MPPESCPNCGAEVPPDARACPECGSDESTGWSDRAHADRLGIPDEEFDHEEFSQREFGGRPLRRRGPVWLWWALAVLLTFLVAAGVLF